MVGGWRRRGRRFTPGKEKVVIVGCPKEIKNNENRVGLTPGGVWALTQAGHTVLVERSAGAGSHFSDDEYPAKGAEIVDSAPRSGRAPTWWSRSRSRCRRSTASSATISCCSPTCTWPRSPTSPKLCSTAASSGIAYETVQMANGELPLLVPMSEVAGRMAVTVGAYYMGYPHGGRRPSHRRGAGGLSGRGPDHRRGHRGDQRRQDGRGSGGAGHHPRSRRRPDEVPGRRPAAELRDRAQRPLGHRAASALLGPGDRRRAGRRHRGSQAGDQRHAAPDAAPVGGRGRGRGPGRLLRDHARDQPPGPGLLRGRRSCTTRSRTCRAPIRARPPWRSPT